MDELIRKQDALDAIHCDITVTGRQNAELVAATIGVFADRIKALPPVQPKRGKWIERNPLSSDKCRLIECDQCGNSYIVGFNVPYEHWIDNRNYCGKCGADMRGEADGQE